MPNAPRPWGEAEDASLAKLWAEGLSASQIAKELSTGRSRNAVIGRVFRKGLPGRKTPIGGETIQRLRKARSRAGIVAVPRFNKVKAPKLEPDLNAIASLKPIDPSLNVLGLNAFTCRYPIGDPQDPAFSFCGRTCAIAGPYCADHVRLCYAPSEQKKRKHDKTARLANWLDRRTFKAAA